MKVSYKKLCKALGCTMNDIMEFIDDDSAQ